MRLSFRDSTSHKRVIPCFMLLHVVPQHSYKVDRSTISSEGETPGSTAGFWKLACQVQGFSYCGGLGAAYAGNGPLEDSAALGKEARLVATFFLLTCNFWGFRWI